jgi:hypothetical protein
VLPVFSFFCNYSATGLRKLLVFWGNFKRLAKCETRAGNIPRMNYYLIDKIGLKTSTKRIIHHPKQNSQFQTLNILFYMKFYLAKLTRTK